MKKQTLLSIAVLLTVLLAGALIYIPLTGSGCDDPPPCCPIINANSIVYPSVICHPDCPGGGSVDVYGNLKFLRGNELCDPDSGFTFYIRNITDKINYPDMQIDKDPKTGLYAFKTNFPLAHDAEFEIHGKGVKDCGKANVKFKVNVLGKDDSKVEHLVFTEKKPSSNLVWSRNLYFGPGIILELIENQNNFRTYVSIDNGTKIFLEKTGDPKDYHEFYPAQIRNAAGTYTVSIPEYDASIYNSVPNPQVVLSLRIRCNCQ